MDQDHMENELYSCLIKTQKSFCKFKKGLSNMDCNKRVGHDKVRKLAADMKNNLLEFKTKIENRQNYYNVDFFQGNYDKLLFDYNERNYFMLSFIEDYFNEKEEIETQFLLDINSYIYTMDNIDCYVKPVEELVNIEELTETYNKYDYLIKHEELFNCVKEVYKLIKEYQAEDEK